MGPARIYPWRKMHRSRAPSIAPGTFFVAQPWADCITNMPGFNLRQAHRILQFSHVRTDAGRRISRRRDNSRRTPALCIARAEPEFHIVGALAGAGVPDRRETAV